MLAEAFGWTEADVWGLDVDHVAYYLKQARKIIVRRDMASIYFAHGDLGSLKETYDRLKAIAYPDTRSELDKEIQQAESWLTLHSRVGNQEQIEKLKKHLEFLKTMRRWGLKNARGR